MKGKELSATQKAAIERVEVLMKEYILDTQPSFLYTQKEILIIIEKNLSSLDEEYIDKYKIPCDLIKGLAKEIYETLIDIIGNKFILCFDIQVLNLQHL